jgi:PadR family transcriptional regulator, regulatory protein PadR
MIPQLLQNLSIELKRGTQIIIVLQALHNEQYGYSLLQDLESKGTPMEAGTLYPLLRRLESQGLLNSKWDTSEARPRKFYKLSEVGVEVLSRLLLVWQQLVLDMDVILKEDKK